MKKKFLASAYGSIYGRNNVRINAGIRRGMSPAAQQQKRLQAHQQRKSPSSAAAEATTGEVPNYDDVWAEKWADVDTI